MYLNFWFSAFINPFSTGVPHMRHPGEENWRASCQCNTVSGLVLRLSSGPCPALGQSTGQPHVPVFLATRKLLFSTYKYNGVSGLRQNCIVKIWPFLSVCCDMHGVHLTFLHGAFCSSTKNSECFPCTMHYQLIIVNKLSLHRRHHEDLLRLTWLTFLIEDVKGAVNWLKLFLYYTHIRDKHR